MVEYEKEHKKRKAEELAVAVASVNKGPTTRSIGISTDAYFIPNQDEAVLGSRSDSLGNARSFEILQNVLGSMHSQLLQFIKRNGGRSGRLCACNNTDNCHYLELTRF